MRINLRRGFNFGMTRIILCGALLGLVGCTEDISDLEKYIAEVKARPKTSIEPLPEVKVIEPYVFNPEGLRNPFRPIERVEDEEVVDVAIGGGIKPDFTRPKEELESYSLDTLRMVGTVDLKSGLWGLVRAADGTIHRVQVGNYLGKNHGRILQIVRDKIEVMEIIPGNRPGTWIEQQASLALKE